MSRNLPEELAPALARTGHQWPQADEDGLRHAAAVWREFGTEAERLAKRGGDSAARVTGENSGPAIDAFAEHWRGFAGGGRGHLDDASGAAGHLAVAFDKAAGAADHCKAQLVAVLTELTEELKQAADAKAKADAAAKAQPTAAAAPVAGVIGAIDSAVGAVAGAVQAAAAEAAEAAHVEAAKLKIAGLLEELGREMKDGLRAALAEPAVTALERIAQAGGAWGDTAHLGASGAVGGAAIAGVGGVSVGYGRDGKLKVLGPDGKPVPASEGLKVAESADGKLVVVGPDGQPVAGIATGADGRPLKGEDGKPLLVGADGHLGASGLTVQLGADGKPVVLGVDGKPVAGLAMDANGRVMTDKHGNPLGLVTDLTGGTGLTGPDGKPLVGVTASTGPNGNQNLGVTAGGATVSAQAGPNGAGVDASDGGVSAHAGNGNRHGGRGDGDGDGRGWSGGRSGDGYNSGGYGSGGGSGYRSDPVIQVNTSAGYDGAPPSPVHHSPGSVQTNSVTLTPPDTSALLGGDAPASVLRAGGDLPSYGGSASSGGGVSGGFSLGPVASGGGAVPSAGMPVAPPPGTPVGAPTPGPVAPQPVAGGVGGPVAGAGGSAGQAGAVAVGVGPQAPEARTGGAAGGAARTPVAPGVGTPVAGAPIAGTSGSATPGAGGGVTAGPVPVRIGPDLPDARRRGDGGNGDSPALGLVPGGIAVAYLVGRALGSAGPDGRPAAAVRTIADSRPYGVPGGLGPVDPAHQAETVRRVPADEDGIPLPHPDPRAGDWAEALNGGGPRESGRANNCVDIALSAVDTFAGRPTCAAPRLPDGPAGERAGRDRTERELGTRFQDLGDGTDAHRKVAQVLLHSGAGAQAMLLTLDEFGRSHTWNAVNHGGVLTYLDHQTARQSGDPLYPADHGLWAIALDADCRPLDLADVQLVTVAPVSRKPAAEPAAEPSQALEPKAEPAVRAAATEEPAPPRSRLTIHRANR